MCASARGASGCAGRSDTPSWRLPSPVRSLSRPILGGRSVDEAASTLAAAVRARDHEALERVITNLGEAAQLAWR